MQLAVTLLITLLIGITLVAGNGVEDSKKRPLVKHRQRQHHQQPIFVTAPPTSTTQTPNVASLEEILSGSASQSTQRTPTSDQSSQQRLYNNG
jgi:hypothetical protein